MEMKALFGTAGNSETYLNTVSKSSLKAPEWLKNIGLDAYEYQCGKGVHIGAETALKLGDNAKESKIRLSLHAPYFINLANPEPEALKKTTDYIVAACGAADLLGADRVVIHSGALMKRTRREAMEIALPSLKSVQQSVDDAGYGHIHLCPETMGKINQLGDLDEVLELCTLDERLIPCIDFGHLYARTLGKFDGEEEMESILNRLQTVLGEERASQFHSHFSHIEFTIKGGEKRHLCFSDPGWGPDFAPLARAVVKRGWTPRFICESAGTQSEDALTMKALYLKYLEEKNSGLL